MKLISTQGALLAAGLILAGCSSTPLTPPPAPAPAPAAPAPAPTPAPAPVAESTVAKVELAAHLDPNSLISKERSVYFDFDNFSVKSEYDALLQRQGQYLGKNAQ